MWEGGKWEGGSWDGGSRQGGYVVHVGGNRDGGCSSGGGVALGCAGGVKLNVNPIKRNKAYPV